MRKGKVAKLKASFRELLKKGEPISEASLRAGFCDQSRFTRFFKAYRRLSVLFQKEPSFAAAAVLCTITASRRLMERIGSTALIPGERQ